MFRVAAEEPLFSALESFLAGRLHQSRDRRHWAGQLQWHPLGHCGGLGHRHRAWDSSGRRLFAPRA